MKDQPSCWIGCFPFERHSRATRNRRPRQGQRSARASGGSSQPWGGSGVSVLAAGRLVAPFGLSVPKGEQWYLVFREFRREEPAFRAFSQWITKAARQ